MRLRVGARSLAVSCSSWSFSCLSFEKAIRVIRALGFSHVDVGFHHLAVDDHGSSRQQGRRLQRKLAGEGMTVTDLFPGLPYETNDPNREHRGKNLAAYRRFLSFAEGCASPGITVKPGVFQPKSRDRGWRIAVEVLGEYAALARTAGLPLSVEPHVDSVIEDPRAARLLVGEVSGLMLTLDYSHFVALGFPARNVKSLHPWTRHFHIRQARRGRLQTSLKEGVIPARRIVEELAASGYRGTICLEYQNSDWHNCNDVDVVSETMATLRALGVEA